MGQPIGTFSLTSALYVNTLPQTSDPKKQVKSDTSTPEDNENQDWIPDPSQRAARRLAQELGGQSDMLQTLNGTSEHFHTQLDSTRFQHTTSFKTFQDREVGYRQAVHTERQDNASMTTKLENSKFSLAVHRPSENATTDPIHNTAGPSTFTPSEKWTPRPPCAVSTTPPQKMNQRTREELGKVAQTYDQGYLSKTLETMHVSSNEQRPTAAFQYTDNLYTLPYIPEQRREGFIFAGPVNNMHDEKAKAAFDKLNFVNCPTPLYVQTTKSEKTHPPQYRQIDVIITGTTDFKQCLKLQEDLLSSVAKRAANQSLPPDNPYADTQVVKFTNNRFEGQGDLRKPVSTATKKMIDSGNFTACPRIKLEPSPLSGMEYKSIGAIVTGTQQDPDVCVALHTKVMSARIQELKDLEKAKPIEKRVKALIDDSQGK